MRGAGIASGASANLGEISMAYVVTEPCIRCKYTDCAVVCPVSCFHEGPNFLVIDPEECIDCDICVPECPVDAIYPEDQVPPEQLEFVALNAELAKVWPVIDTKKDAPPDAAAWVGVKVKRRYLQR
jgi:ferredoxin